jgi:hypothetical protein
MPELDSLSALVADLESQLAFHQRQEGFHAEQEELHRERRGFHAAERARLAECLQALCRSAEEARTLAARTATSALADEDLGPRSRPKVTRMVARVVEDKLGSSRFGVRQITQEINRRFAAHIKIPVKEKQVSIVLARLAAAGRIYQIRPGRPYQEALFTRQRPG